MLISIFSLYIHSGTTDIEIIWLTEYNNINKYIIWLAFFFSFAIKVPIFPFHIWLPEAHVEAPTEGSVFLAAILLKLGTYGFLRFLFPVFPDVTIYFAPLVLLLASLAVFYTSLTTIRQVDIKKIIAYSSVAHMNVCIIGLFSFHITSLNGSIFLMIGHGIVSSGLFFIIGFLYSRYYTKIIKYYSGIVQTMPLLSIAFFFFTLGNISMPLTSNFVGELLILIGTYNVFNFFPLFLIGFSICLLILFETLNITIEDLKNKNREIEKILSANTKPLVVPTLKDLNTKLVSGEAFIEIVRINKQSRNATKKGIDIVKMFTDSISYGAIVIKKNSRISSFRVIIIGFGLG